MTAYDLFDTDRPMRAIEQTTRTVEPYLPDDGGRLLTYASPWLRTSVANSWLALRWLLIAAAGTVVMVVAAGTVKALWGWLI